MAMQHHNPQNPIVFMDFALKEEPLGRVKMELFADLVPKTAENFRVYCTGSTRSQLNQPVGYKSSLIHRVIKNFMIQGGDFLNNNGSGSTCIYGTRSFADEGFHFKHEEAGILSMANSGPNTNGSQFFITLAKAEWLDGKHVVFGRVIEGMEVVRKIENTRLEGEKPRLDVVVRECGEM